MKQETWNIKQNTWEIIFLIISKTVGKCLKQMFSMLFQVQHIISVPLWSLSHHEARSWTWLKAFQTLRKPWFLAVGGPFPESARRVPGGQKSHPKVMESHPGINDCHAKLTPKALETIPNPWKGYPEFHNNSNFWSNFLLKPYPPGLLSLCSLILWRDIFVPCGHFTITKRAQEPCQKPWETLRKPWFCVK